MTEQNHFTRISGRDDEETDPFYSDIRAEGQYRAILPSFPGGMDGTDLSFMQRAILTIDNAICKQNLDDGLTFLCLASSYIWVGVILSDN